MIVYTLYDMIEEVIRSYDTNLHNLSYMIRDVKVTKRKYQGKYQTGWSPLQMAGNERAKGADWDS